MVVLALETATRRGSVALWIDGALYAERGDSTRTHGERLPGELMALLEAHHCSMQSVDVFAVIGGPGSFTGLRVGIATIQGLALTSGRSVVVVPTLEAMAVAYRDIDREADGGGARRADSAHDPLIVACLDGQRGDVFFAAWRASALDRHEFDAGEAVIAPSVGRPADLREQLRAHDLTGESVLIGDGAVRHASSFEGLGVAIQDVNTPLAGIAASLAARRSDRAVSPHALRPMYIRRPDAVLARERAGLSTP